jgi:phospholipid/cholesterol/gamma-HCH transport system permease protein
MFSTLVMLGDFVLFLGRALQRVPRLWFRWGVFLRHCEYIGLSSAFIVAVAAFFTGAVLGYQLYVAFHQFGAEALVGGALGLAVYRELGPVMASIMVTGRAGAAIAAEIASMRISEQIDALEVMAVNPVEFLVTPRVMAGFLMLPILGLLFSTVATIAGAFVSCTIMDLDSTIFWTQFTRRVDVDELIHCIVKSAAFGVVLTSVACFFGFRAQGGAKGVGLATRITVVASILSILFVDYLLTSILPFGFTWLKL